MKLAYTIDEAAEATGLSSDTIRRAIRSTAHHLKAKRSNRDAKGNPTGKHLILADDLRDWLDGLEDA